MEKVKRLGIDGKEHTYIVFNEEEIATKKAEIQKRQEEIQKLHEERHLKDE